jgi:hypothetical protein
MREKEKEKAAEKKKKREKNLKPLNTRSEKERKEIAKMGADASNKKQKEKKLLKDTLLALLETNDGQDQICTALFGRARRGDIRAFEVIRDTVGQKPIDKTELTGANGGPIRYEDLSDEEIDKRLAEIEKHLKK